MNIQAQLCGLLIMILLFVLYKSNDTLKLYTENIFYKAMCISTLCLCLDILSVIGIYYKEFLPLMIVKALCKAYNVTVLWVLMYTFVYVLSDLLSEKRHLYWTKIIKCVVFIQSIISCILPISIYSKDEDIYTYGIGILIVYIFGVIYVLVTIVTTVIYFKKLNRRRALAVILWMLIYIFAVIIQFINNEILLVGFAISMGFLILFIVMENPDANLDRKIGCFNANALFEYMRKKIGQQKKFCVMEISITDSELFDEDNTFFNQALRDIVDNVKINKKGKIFKDFNSNIIIISDNIDNLENVVKSIANSYVKHKNIENNARIIILEDGLAFNNIGEMLLFFNYIRQKHAKEIKTIIRIDEKMIADYMEKSIIEEKISAALNDDRVEVFFQPIYSNKEERFSSAEALIRIRQDDGSLLSPGCFIPVAEDNGQIVELGERVFEIVCKFIKDNDLASLGIKYIEVNLSVIQCEMYNLAQRLIAIVEKYEINPNIINLEITETKSISARNILLKNMQELIEYGFSFSLDDFGKGESNLMYVVEMPVSIVKLDYDMSKSYFNTDKAKHVVSAVVGMAHDMQIKLVAEGIETEEELTGMRNEGIDYIQGFYYSKPIPAMEFLSFIKENNV